MTALLRFSAPRARMAMLAISALLFCAACHFGPRAEVPVEGETAHEPRTLVLLGDGLDGGPFLPPRIVVDYQDAVRTRENLLRVQVNIRNRSRSPVGIQVQTLFKDDEWNWAGEKVDWKLIRILPGETKSYVATSETAAPVRYTVRIRSFP